MKKLSRSILALSLPVMAFAAMNGFNKSSAWFVSSYLIVFDGLKGEGDILENEINSDLVLVDDDVLSANENVSFVVSADAIRGARYYNINFKALGSATLSYMDEEIVSFTTEEWSEYTCRFYVASADEKPTISVTIDDGNEVLINDVNIILASKRVSAGSEIGELPELPTKEGYAAIAWTIDDVELTPETTYDYGESRIAYPKYEANKYTVTFEDTELEPVVVNYGETVSKPDDPVKEGFNFVGWCNGDVEFDFNTPITEDTVLTPAFEEIVVEEPEPEDHEDHCCCPHKHHHAHHHHHNPAFCDENEKTNNGNHNGQDNGNGNKGDKTNNGNDKDDKTNNGKGNGAKKNPKENKGH